MKEEHRRTVFTAAAALLPIIAEWIYKFALRPRPFWVQHYDPETIYFYDGLRLLAGKAPLNTDHPGTPLQILSAAIALFTGRTPLRFEAFRLTAYVAAMLLTAAAVVFLLRTLFRNVDPFVAVAGVWTYFLAPQALERDLIWSAEIIYFAAGALALVAVERTLREGSTTRDALIAGASIGLCIATKFVFLGWALAFLLLARHRILAAIGMAGGFVAATAVAWTRYPRMFAWIWQIASRTGEYGTGRQAPPDLGRTARAYADLLMTSKSWLLWAAVVVALIVLARRATDRRVVLFGLTAAVATYLIAFRAPGFRYVLPAGLAFVLLFHAGARRLRRPAAIAVCVLAALLLGKALVADARSHRQQIEDQTALRARIDAAVRRLAPPGSVVIYSWRVPEPSFALRVMTTDPKQLEEIAMRYPREGHFNDFIARVYLPPGATRWDVLVIGDSVMWRFPEPVGRPVARVDGYRIFAREAGR